MLRDNPFHLAEWPGVVVYPDDQPSQRLFYACAAHPRLAREESGDPSISLLVYTRRGSNPPDATGGQLMATVSLQLSAAEQRGIEASLNGRVIYPDWIEADVTMQGTADLALKATPSMMGGNDCILSAALSGAQASVLARDWPGPLHETIVRYHCVVHGVAAPEASSRTARPLPIVIEGPLLPAGEPLAGRMQLVSF